MTGKKIAVVILNEIISVVGGAITAFYKISGILAENNEVFGIFHDSRYSEKFKQLDNGVKLYNLYDKTNKNIKSIFDERISEINPDVIIFFYPRDVKKLLNKDDFPSIKKVLLNRSRPDFYREYPDIKEIISDFSCTQVFFDSFKKFCEPYFKGPVVTIENAIPVREKTVDLDNEKKRIIFLSRIDIWKGADLLINAAKIVHEKQKDWQFYLYGQIDPRRYAKKLQELINKNGLKDTVFLAGITKNIEEAFLNSDICAFPSYFEGVGNGLIEAQSYGLPAVILRGCSGANEIVTDGYNGFLADDTPEDFAEKLLILIEDKAKRIEMSKNSLENNKKYTEEIIKNKWNELVAHLDDNDFSSIECKEPKKDVEIFPLQKIYDLLYKNRQMSFVQRIFSVSNFGNKKMVCVLGIKFII